MDAPSHGAGLDRAKILVVDDDPDIQKITKLNLIQEGFDVAQAYSGLECIEYTRSERPDVILLDLMMPELDGFETCKRLKSVDSTRDIPVIVVTALEDVNDKLRCFSFKADDYVVKPYAFEDLLARIYLHLNKSIDLKEREQKSRTSILRDVLRELSEGIATQYQLIAKTVAGPLKRSDPGSTAVIHEANEEIIRIVESTREHEDPYYESPWISTDIDVGEDEDLDLVLDDLPEPPNLGSGR